MYPKPLLGFLPNNLLHNIGLGLGHLSNIPLLVLRSDIWEWRIDLKCVVSIVIGGYKEGNNINLEVSRQN